MQTKIQRKYGTKEWDNEAFFSGNYSNKEGVCILLNANVAYKVLKHTEIVSSRLQAIELEIEHRTIVIISIYGPNSDDCTVFEQLEKYLSEKEDKTFILGGDFNTVLNENIHKKNVKLM